MKTPRARHFDVPSIETDDGAFLREGAAQSTGFRMGQDLEASRAELVRNGGPESIVRNAIKRIAKEQK